MPKKATKSAKNVRPSKPAAPPAAQEKQKLINIGEMTAFLQNLPELGLEQLLDDPGGDSLKDEAQDLAFDAMEAESEAEARELAKRALAKDPDCIDALVILASIESESPKKLIEAMRKAVATGERSLGAKFIEENKGHFWLILETRPYMRTLAHLASLLRGEELNLEAIAQYEKMLALNPNDNQGVRYPLLGLYLATGDLEAARKLLNEYEEDSANFAWGRVLERFLSADFPGAAAALKIARKENHFVELYLSGQKELPEELPDMYSPGSEEEAFLCLENFTPAWAGHKEAVFWLMDQVLPEKAKKKAPAKPRKKPIIQ
jgi:tetratricopeptide (TPR) repeat protein